MSRRLSDHSSLYAKAKGDHSVKTGRPTLQKPQGLSTSTRYFTGFSPEWGWNFGVSPTGQ
jgi:hypothetical protein